MRAFLLLAALTATSVLLSPLAASSQPTGANGDPVEGRRLALMFCTACHVVAPDQAASPIFNGPPKPPSFRAIANNPATTAASLRTFLSTTHSNLQQPIKMPNPELDADQMQNITAFILSLRPHPTGPRKR